MAVLRKDGDVTAYVLQTKHKGKGRENRAARRILKQKLKGELE